MNSLIFCEALAAITITGAVETAPGWMQVDYLNDDGRADFIVIPKEHYLECNLES